MEVFFDNDEETPLLQKIRKKHQIENRSKLEAPASGSFAKWPKIVSGRAVCYSSLIYQWATNDIGIPLQWVEDKLDVIHGKGSGGTPELLLWSGRTYYGLVDERPGLAIIKVTGKGKQDWTHLYVVFRGSRGDEIGSTEWKMFSKNIELNPQGAGWGRDEGGNLKNVDWRANLDNQQVACGFAPVDDDVKIHRGFQEVYMSLRLTIKESVVSEIQKDTNVLVVVTGHSLGASLGTLCAYDLVHCVPNHKKTMYLAFCCPRAGNAAYVKDFNNKLAYQDVNIPIDGGSYKRAFRFDQKNDPVTSSQKYAFKKNVAWDNPMPEKGMLSKGWDMKWMEEDTTQKYYHVQNRINIAVTGMHGYADMMDDILTPGYNPFRTKVSQTKGLFVHTN